MSNFKHLASAARDPRRVVRKAKATARVRLGNRAEFTEEDERRMAAEYDRARGYDRPRRERSKEAHELAEGAPVVRWTPPALRPRM